MSNDDEREASGEAIEDEGSTGDAEGSESAATGARAGSEDAATGARAGSEDAATGVHEGSEDAAIEVREGPEDAAIEVHEGPEGAVTEAQGEDESGSGERPALGGEPGRPWRVLMVGRELPLWMVVAQLLLAPAAAAAAVGVHWWLNVPDQIVKSPRDQGAGRNDRKKKGKPRRDARNRGRSRNAYEERSAKELEAARERYAASPFEDEPTLGSWARRHQTIINRAVIVARKAAFEGAPEQPRVVLEDTECRTVRCRFTLRSQYPHALEAVGEALSRLQSADEDVWHHYERTAVPKPPDEQEHYTQVTVSFRTDGTESRSLSIRSEEDEEGAEEGAEEEAEQDDEPGAEEEAAARAAAKAAAKAAARGRSGA